MSQELLTAHYNSVNRRANFLASMIRSRIGEGYWVKIVRKLMIHRQRPGYQALDDMKVIYAFVRDSLRYTREKDGTDVFMMGEEALKRGYGDCDEQTQIVGILASNAGYRVKVKAVGFRGKGGRFTHIYPLAFVNGTWVPMDVTYQKGVGVEVPHERSIEVEV